MRIHRIGGMLLPILAIAFMATYAPVATAAPYACEITNVAGSVNFYLGESANDVVVNFDNGTVSTNLGTLSAGKNSFALGTHTNYSIVVTKNGAGTFNKISVDAAANSFFGPRGVAVNRNPGSSFFGRIYVVNASAGTGSAPAQAVGRGVYVLNADTSDCLGYGSTAKTPGMTLGSSTTYSPYRCFVGSDDTVYVGNSDSVSISGGTSGNSPLWYADPNLTTGGPFLAFTIPGGLGGTNAACASTPFVTGSLAAGNLSLTCMLWGYPSNSATLGNAAYGSNVCSYIYSFNIGSGPLPWATPPQTNAIIDTNIANVNGVTEDLYIAPDGKIFVSQYRTGNTGVGNISLYVYASDAQTYLWDSQTAGGGADPFNTIYGVAVSPDDKYVAAIHSTDGSVLLAKLTNGVPDISTLVTNVTGLSGTTRSLAWDAADNVYVDTGGATRLAVYSLGFSTTATTYNDITGTNGTFSLYVPSTTASVVAITNQASQSGPTPGVFQISRAGQNLNLPLTVTFILGGTASNNVYTCSPAGITPAATNTITIAANQLSTNITITPVNDGVPRPTTTVILSVQGGTNYTAAAPSQDTVYIQNIGPQLVFISGAGVSSVYNAFSNDYASFTVTRWGDTNAASYPVNSFSLAGTAVSGYDYTTPTVTINPGDVADTVYVYPLINGQMPIHTNNLTYTGNKTIIVSIGNGSGYTGATNATTLTIIDSANPTATVLFSDPLTDPNDVTNWGVRSANDNMQTNAIDNYIDFGYDLYNDPRDPEVIAYSSPGFVPIPFPPSGATTALRLTVNKTQPEGSGAGGAVNLYLTNAFFNGNYAVRYNMNLVEGYNTLYTSEGALFGIDHTGQATNWFAGSTPRSGWSPTETQGWESDGVWCWASVDDGVGTFAGGPSAYMVFTGVGGQLPNSGWANPPIAQDSAAQFANNFKSAVFTSSGGPGLAANESPDNAPDGPIDYNSWSDVELKQFNNVVTISIDKTLICVYTNTTTWTNGCVMLGYEDPYDSVGGGDAAVYYSNLRVVRLTPPLISEIAYNSVSSTFVFNFTTTDGDLTTSSFVVQGASVVTGPYTDVAGATITQLSSGAFQATAPVSGSIQFYRIRQK